MYERNSYEYRPLFKYKYHPLNSKRQNDGGFTVILYNNAILSFSVYGERDQNTGKVCLDENCFYLPGFVLDHFFSLLKNAGSWLEYMPADLRNGSRGKYSSLFAFDGYDPNRVLDIETLVTAPMGTSEGYYARHMYVLFEDVANILAVHGIQLTLNSFHWDNNVIQPFKRPMTGNYYAAL